MFYYTFFNIFFRLFFGCFERLFFLQKIGIKKQGVSKSFGNFATYFNTDMNLDFSLNFSTPEIYLLALLVFIGLIEIFYQFFFFYRPTRFYKKAQKGKVDYSNQCPPISIIVYSPNDSESLIENMPKILNQDYPQFEVIVVTEESAEESKDILSSLEVHYKNLYHTFVPNGARSLSQKKLALTLGIKASHYDIVAFTNGNCTPSSNRWLASLARNFVPGTDIVIGYTATCRNAKERFSFWYETYDRLLFALRYLSFALIRRPYMGVSSNMAYRKELFFNNKGFSKHLHLRYGDDDLFINEIANRTNTRVEISADSQMTAVYDDNHWAWRELKQQYDFTARYLRTGAKCVFLLSKCFDYAFNLLWIAGVVVGLKHHAFVAIISLCLALILFIIKVCVYRKSAKVFRAPRLFFALPLFSMIYPFVNLQFKVINLRSRKKNFTW